MRAEGSKLCAGSVSAAEDGMRWRPPPGKKGRYPRLLLEYWRVERSSVDAAGSHSSGLPLRLFCFREALPFLTGLLPIAQFFKGAGKLVVRAGVAGVQCNRLAQGGNRLCYVALEKQSFSQVIKCVRILCIYLSGAAQVENCGFPVAGFQLSMPELEKDIRVWRRTRKLFLIFNYGLVIFSQTRVCKAEMVMA